VVIINESTVHAVLAVFEWDGSFFFFQAEDGIRDGHVTGVQTCALPIYHRNFAERTALNSPLQGTAADLIKLAMIGIDRRLAEERSEERRVGKECRSWGWMCALQKKNKV